MTPEEYEAEMGEICDECMMNVEMCICDEMRAYPSSNGHEVPPSSEEITEIPF